MSQDLDNYIKQARTAGQSDEQIRAALNASGWADAEISQFLQAPGAVNAPASFSWLSAKGAGILGILLLAVAVGVYFAFFRNNGSENETIAPQLNSQNQSTSPNLNENSEEKMLDLPSFQCADIFPEADFKRIIGTGSEEFKLHTWSKAGQLDCTHTSNNDWNSFNFDIGLAPSGDMAFYWNYMRQFNISKGGKEVSGIGQSAYFSFASTNSLEVLSSNGKYAFSVSSLQGGSLNGITEDVVKAIAKVIDSSLNKY